MSAKGLSIAGFTIFFLSPSLQPIAYNAAIAPLFTTPVLLLVAATLYFLHRKSAVAVHSFILFPFVLAVAPILVHAHQSTSENQLYYLAFVISVFFAWLLGGNIWRRDFRQLFSMFVLGAVLWSSCALIVWLGFTDGGFLRIGDWLLSTHIQSKINGPFANGNVLGILAFCAATGSLWLWLTSKSEYKHLWLIPLIFLWSIGIASMSRGAWISHAIVLLIALPLAWKHSKKMFLMSIASLVVSMALAHTIHSNNAYSGKDFEFSERYSSTVEGGFGVRTQLWASVFEIWNQNKISGTGYGKLSSQFLTGQGIANEKYAFSQSTFDYVNSGHNIILHLMAEAGFAGIILSILISLLVAWAILLNWQRINSYAWPATMIAFMLWLQGMANITMNRPFPILLFTLALAIALTPALREWKKRKIHHKPIFMITALSILALSIIGHHQLKLWWDYEEWLITADNTARKKELSLSLLQQPDIMPYIVAVTMQKVITDPARNQYAPKLLPFIHKAIELQEHRILYQGLFFGQVLNNDISNACKTGMFLERQLWSNNANSEFHHAACEGRLDSNFHITPKEASEPLHPTNP